MTASVVERGYEATRVSDLVELSGVSSRTFYDLFSDKRACFLATMDAILRGSLRAAGMHYDGRGSALAAFIDLIIEQPAAARLCFVQAYSAGPEAVAAMDQAVARVEKLYERAFAAREGEPPMPEEICQAIVGGLRRIVYARLRRGEERKLRALVPQLWEWSFGYAAPVKPLARPQVKPGEPGRYQPGDPVERIIQATTETVAEKGFPEATVGEIVSSASVSLRTFYGHFDSKEAAVMAALDARQSQMLGVTLPSYRRANDWPSAVRAAFETMFAFLAVEPAYARMGMVEIYGAGTAALDRRDRTIEELQTFVAPGYEYSPKTSPIASEAIGGATYSLVYNHIRAHGPESLPQLAPMATYITLAPFLGAEEASTVANGSLRR